MEDAYYLKKIPQSVYRNTSLNKKEITERQPLIDVDLKNLNIKSPSFKNGFRERIEKSFKDLIGILLPEEIQESEIHETFLNKLFEKLGVSQNKKEKTELASNSKQLEKQWTDINVKIINNIKIHLLKYYVGDIIRQFNPKINYIVRRYSRHLPQYVAEGEIDDLSTIAKLELLETLKVWDPSVNADIWPLAQARIIGAMKDHIRYITKSDPSRFYEWVTDAAHLYMTVNDRADFEKEIETGIELSNAMKVLTYRERKIMIAHTKDDRTFKEIGNKLGISESQISRIYKKAVAKVKKELDK